MAQCDKTTYVNIFLFTPEIDNNLCLDINHLLNTFKESCGLKLTDDNNNKKNLISFAENH